jgi:hypothetical protein
LKLPNNRKLSHFTSYFIVLQVDMSIYLFLFVMMLGTASASAPRSDKPSFEPPTCDGADPTIVCPELLSLEEKAALDWHLSIMLLSTALTECSWHYFPCLLRPSCFYQDRRDRQHRRSCCRDHQSCHGQRSSCCR